MSLEGGAGGPNAYAGDYLYYSTLGRDFQAGAWGLLRVHDKERADLQPLPERPPEVGDGGFPQLSFTGQAPPRRFDGPGEPCPADAPLRSYNIVIDNADIVYNDLSAIDQTGVVYRLRDAGSEKSRSPLVLRTNAGECLELIVRNDRIRRASISLGELVVDPQRSYGAAIGYNFETTIPGGGGRRYRYYADRELGLVLGLNLAQAETLARGVFAGVVVEPEGSQYYRPGRMEPLPQGGAGVQADIVIDGVLHREYVALFNDQDRRIGQNAMPYPVEVERFAGINYAHEPLSLRAMNTRPADVFKSAVWATRATWSPWPWAHR